MFYAALGNFLAIDEERSRTALADAAAIIGELITDGYIPDRYRRRSSNGALEIKKHLTGINKEGMIGQIKGTKRRRLIIDWFILVGRNAIRWNE